MSRQFAFSYTSRAPLFYSLSPAYRTGSHTVGNAWCRRPISALSTYANTGKLARQHRHSLQQHQQQRHKDASKDTKEAISQVKAHVSRLLSEEWTAISEAQAIEALESCHRIASDSEQQITADETLQLCQVADQLGKMAVKQELKRFPLGPFTKYLEFYAHLGRPDVTQQAFSRVKSQWRQPSMAVYAAQQLALLRFAGDVATGGQRLLQTMPAAGHSVLKAEQIVKDRLAHRTVSEVIEDALRRERRTKRLVKAFEYGSYTALAALIAKWAWIGNSVLLTGVGIVPKALASIAALLVSAASVRLVLRHSVMGSITSPSLSGLRQSTGAIDSRQSNERLSRESDDEARRILRRAFPASPSDDAMMEISELLSSSHALRPPRLSWRLRMALAWSKFARRFAVVEPVMISDRGLLQRLAMLWLRAIVQMFPAGEAGKGGDTHSEVARASSAMLHELVVFIRKNFATTPLALTHRDIVAISQFAASYVDTHALREFLALATSGSLVLVRNSSAETAAIGDQHPVNQVAEVSMLADALVAMAGSDIRRHNAGATILALTTCIHKLSQPASHPRLEAALQMLIESTDIPVSTSLYRTAFAAAATALGNLELSTRLAGCLVERYRVRDPRIRRILQPDTHPLSAGWRLSHAAAPTRPAPIVGCIAPHLSLLAQQPLESADGNTKQNTVSGFVEEWLELGILNRVSALQCLSAATQSLSSPGPSQQQQPSTCVETWAALGCRIFDPKSAESVRALYSLLSSALKFSDIAGTTESGLRIYLMGNEAVLQGSQRLQDAAPGEFNALSIKIFTTLAQEHAPSEQARQGVRLALDVLDRMRICGQAPSWSVFEKLCATASELQIDVSKEARLWSRQIKERARSNKMSSFAKSLF